jgi:hypothetical protein
VTRFRSGLYLAFALCFIFATEFEGRLRLSTVCRLTRSGHDGGSEIEWVGGYTRSSPLLLLRDMGFVMDCDVIHDYGEKSLSSSLMVGYIDQQRGVARCMGRILLC